MKTKFWIICLSVFFVSCLRNMHDIYTGEEEEEGSPDKPGGLSIQLCKSEKKEFYIRYSS